ncbi:hypothetical protein [Halomicrococcus sp. SG-WS-1]|uniref:hypothetical protein n=1 Tax=Halomicrococcus sp. SG-WS-1 TaxID=3439057 RepID=UPI003F7ADED9
MDDSFYPSLPRRIRQRIGPVVDRIARRVGQPDYRVRPAGYVGTVHRSIDDVESTLRDGGFVWDPMSLYHYTPAGSTTDGSWVYRPSQFANRQLHVVLFAQTENRVDVYAHEEYNWKRHPLKHAKEEDIRRHEGSAEMRRWLEKRGVAYECEPKVIRRAEQVVERVRERIHGRDFAPSFGLWGGTR